MFPQNIRTPPPAARGAAPWEPGRPIRPLAFLLPLERALGGVPHPVEHCHSLRNLPRAETQAGYPAPELGILVPLPPLPVPPRSFEHLPPRHHAARQLVHVRHLLGPVDLVGRPAPAQRLACLSKVTRTILRPGLPGG